MKKPILRRGDSNRDVINLKALLRSQGFWEGTSSDVFGPQLEAAVKYFQSTHLDSSGSFLKTDGVVGEKTWWALENPVGAAQRSNLVGTTQFVQGLVPTRVKLIEVVLAEHKLDVREIPTGSNGGGRVDTYTAGFGRAPWCALFCSWAWKEVSGHWPGGVRRAHVQSWWKAARQDGTGFTKSTYKPIPGDLAVWAFSGGTGHISVVVAVDPNDRMVVNTVGGNEGDRLKLGLRRLQNEANLVGFINLHGDTKTGLDIQFKRGLFTSGSSGPITLTGSR